MTEMAATITIAGFVLIGAMIFLGYEKQAAYAVLLTLVIGLAYRFFIIGDSLREIAITLGLCGGLLVIGIWGATSCQRIIEDYRKAKS